VGRQEEELLEIGKLLKSISIPDNPAPKGRQDGSEEGFKMRFERKNNNKPRKNNTSR